MSSLVQNLQQERSAVAIFNFHYKTSNIHNATGLQQYVANGVNLTQYTMAAVVLQIHILYKLTSKILSHNS